MQKNLARVSATALLSSLLLSHIPAARATELRLEGQVQDFLAVKEVKGYNCSQYNPCNSTDPVRSDSVRYGDLTAGSSFVSTIKSSPTGSAGLFVDWASTDGKASFDTTGLGGSRIFLTKSSTASNDVLTLETAVVRSVNATPYELRLNYAFAFQSNTFASTSVTGADLLEAVQAGRLVSATGRATFNSCEMIQNYWGEACGGHMTLAIGAVPEPQTWALMALGLGLIAARRVQGGAKASRQAHNQG